jgi:cobalt/nickel transport system ATP-binding protein
MTSAILPPPPAIEVRDLHFHYSNSDGSLHGINFSIADGECVAIIGPNGAGKSTLLLHLNGILPESFGRAKDAGSVSVFGQAIAPNNLREVRRQVGLLFQDADDQLFCSTVFEDVAFGPSQFGLDAMEVERRVQSALAAVGLIGFDKREPHRLSGGEKRRVCLAGVLACDPRVLVLDEPTSGLDPRGRRELKLLLKGLAASRIIATHDLEMVVELCPRSIVLDGGIIVADGPTLDLLADEELMLRHGLETPAVLKRK